MNKPLYFLVLVLLTPSLLLGIPFDFDSNGLSDPSSTKVNSTNQLKWSTKINAVEIPLSLAFGSLVDHVAAANYFDQETNLATIDYSGRWNIFKLVGQTGTFIHGATNALYLSGADFDGDGLADAAYSNNVCEQKPSKTFFKLNPLGASPIEISFPTGKGFFYKTYLDTNNDGRDEFCIANPIKSKSTMNGRFQLICYDVLSKQKVLGINLKKLYEAPRPLRNRSGADYILTYRNLSNSTLIRVIDVTGKTIKNIKIELSGKIILGQFQEGSVEQIAVVDTNDRARIYNLETNKIRNLSFPSGAPFDHTNINYFTSASNNYNCFCNTTVIQANGGSCQTTTSNETPDVNTPDTNTPPVLGNNNCDFNRLINDGPDGWLHKPVSDSDGKIVNLTKTSDYPATCRYENPNGSLFRAAYLSSFSNPDRPTWRPIGGGGCREYPDNLIFACQIKSKKYCWNIPDPCSRYD